MLPVANFAASEFKPLRGKLYRARRRCKQCASKKRRVHYAANFEKARAERRTQYAANPRKSIQGVRNWERRNPEKLMAWRQVYNLKQYGMTPADKARMVKTQRGKCLICNKKKKVLVVDHCHKTGKVRGLLCHSCNRLLGLYEKWRDSGVFDLYLKGQGTGRPQRGQKPMGLNK